MPGERILIVEDERTVARGLEYGLEKEGFAVLLAENGGKALDLARTQKPHLILLDIRLPDISGFDICRQLRGEGARMPILMLTARDEAIDKVLGLELGADDYRGQALRSARVDRPHPGFAAPGLWGTL